LQKQSFLSNQQTFRHTTLPEKSLEESEEQENRANLRHVESGSIRRKRHREEDAYIRHPSDPNFRLGLYFAHYPFITYLARSPAFRGQYRFYRKMPELEDGFSIQNGGQTADELLQTLDNDQTRHWDPTALLEKLYKVIKFFKKFSFFLF
jgi:hypothetical protein